MSDRGESWRGDSATRTTIRDTNDAKGIETSTIEDKIPNNDANGDIALGLAAELNDSYIPSAEIERPVLRKIDFILLPIISCTATLSFLDKVSNNYANNYGLSKALGMTGDQFSWSASVFYFGFLVWQPVVSYMVQHYPLGRVISLNCMCWGLVLLGQGFVKNYPGFVVLRFLQGVFEACVLPTLQLMTSIWWTRKEQSLRVAFWFNSVAGILGGIFAYGIGQWKVLPGFYLYQYVYITYGSFTVAWGIMLFFVVPASPVTAWFLSHEEKLATVARVKDNQTGMVNRHFQRYQFIETLCDPKTWMYCFFAFVSNLVNGSLNAYSTTIIHGFGFTPLNTTLLMVPWGVTSTISNILVGLAISHTHNKRLYLMSGVILLPLIGMALQFSLSGPRGVLLFAYYMTGPYNSPYVMLMALIASNTAGTTKKVVTSAIIWIAYCAGNIVGPFSFREEEAPRYSSGLGVVLASFTTQCVFAIVLRIYFSRLNAKKDRDDPGSADNEEQSATEAFADLTDKENPRFRYTY